jgi:hypothetical protein
MQKSEVYILAKLQYIMRSFHSFLIDFINQVRLFLDPIFMTILPGLNQAWATSGPQATCGLRATIVVF